MGIPELETEIKFFEEHREDLLRRAPGKFAVIKGTECIGVFDTADSAYEEGAMRFPGEPFLIQPIWAEDPIGELPALYTGALYAGV